LRARGIVETVQAAVCGPNASPVAMAHALGAAVAELDRMAQSVMALDDERS
jgi:hypothetical protein